MANVIKHKRGSGSDPGASDLVVGEVAIRTDVGKLFTKMDNGSVAEIAGGGSDIAINTLSSSSATGGGSATFNGSAYRFTLSQPPSVSAQQLLVSINGVIQKPVAGTGQPSEGFSVSGNDIILGDAPATGADFFILTFKSLGVSEPADNSVTSAKIADGAIVNADINASAAIAGTKISPDFGSQQIETTGVAHFGNEIRATGDTPHINFIDSGDNPDFQIGNINGGLRFQDTTNSAARMLINADGHIDIAGNLDVGAGLDVTGVINSTIDSADNTLKIETTTSGDAKLSFNAAGAGGHDIEYIRSSNTLNFKQGGGSVRMSIAANGTVDVAGNLDVGAGLDVTGAIKSTGNISLDNSSELGVFEANTSLGFSNSAKLSFDFSSNLARIRSSGNGSFSARPLTFNIVNTEAMRIDSDGRLLLGTTTEGHGSADDLTINNSANGGITIRTGTSSNGAIFFSDATSGTGEYDGFVQYNHGSDPFMLFGVGSNTRMAIKGSNVGIGTTTPSTLLNIKGTDTAYSGGVAVGAIFQGEDSSGRKVQLVAPGSVGEAGVGTPTNHSFTLFTGNTERIRIDTSGNVGIGTASPAQKFHVYGNSGVTSIALGDNSTTQPYMLLEANETDNLCTVHSRTNNPLTFRIDNTERMRIDSSGKVFIGDTLNLDSNKVNIFGTKAYSSGIPQQQLAVADAQAYNTTDNGGSIGFLAKFNSSGAYTTMGSIEGVKHNNIDGNYQGAIAFKTRNNNGDNVIRMRLTDNGLCFGTDTAGANALADYEEGTAFTSTGDATVHQAAYTKVGKLVSISFRASVTAGNSQQMTLPFVHSGNHGDHVLGVVVTAGTFKQISLDSSSTFTLTDGFSKGTLTYPTNT